MPKTFTATLQGAKEAHQGITKLLKDLHGKEFREALIPGARIFYQSAYENAPYDPEREKGTHFRDALFIDAREHTRKQTDILVGINHKKAPHGHLLELGWSKKPEGVPTLRPAAIRTYNQVYSAVATAVKQVVEKSVTQSLKQYRFMWE